MVKVADHLIEGILIQRLNRFVAIVEIDGKLIQAHVLNPGRMKEFFVPGVTVFVEYRPSPKRKLDYSLLYVKREETLILINSVISNKIVYEALVNRKIKEFEHVKLIEKEKEIQPSSDRHIQDSQKKRRKTSRVKSAHSRFDFILDNKIVIEVKSTNYCINGIGLFPDAPSLRAQKHVKELISLKTPSEGEKKWEPYIFFVAQRTDIKEIRPFDRIDPEFGRLLRKANEIGVKIRGYGITFLKEGHYAELGEELPISMKYTDIE